MIRFSLAVGGGYFLGVKLGNVIATHTLGDSNSTGATAVRIATGAAATIFLLAVL
jgi:hypothetical protein